MPFPYYGAKHGLARRYPPPAYSTIVEPFAGSAGYATFFATAATRVILIEKDALVVKLWRDLQTMTVADLDEIGAQLRQDRVSHPFFGGLAGGDTLTKMLRGKSQARSSNMTAAWPMARSRIASMLPTVRNWTIIEGDYTDAPNIEATWFVDPPYQVHNTMAGSAYREGSAAIDYDALAAWCRSRRGQVIVCEQEPAAWLPFRPLARQRAWVGGDTKDTADRVEVVWSRTPGRMNGTKASAAARADAIGRRVGLRNK